MASASQTAIAPGAHRIAGRNGLVDKYFYLFAALLAAAIVVFGFGRTVEGNLFHALPPRPLLLWFHGAAFSLWVLFFIFQAALVRTHNVKLHRFFGWFGAGLGTTMIVLGVAVAIVMGRFDTYTLHQQGADAFLIVPLFDMVAFATFFGLAIALRRKPELHRRLIFIATCGLLAAAFGRMPYIGDRVYMGVDAFIFLGVIRDLVVSRRIHKVYLVALPVLFVCHLFVIRTVEHTSVWWVKIADRILG